MRKRITKSDLIITGIGSAVAGLILGATMVNYNISTRYQTAKIKNYKGKEIITIGKETSPLFTLIETDSLSNEFISKEEYLKKVPIMYKKEVEEELENIIYK